MLCAFPLTNILGMRVEETRLDTNRGDPSLSKSNLLKTYIWYLIDTEQYDLVPLYACHVHGAYVKYIYATLFELLVNEDFEVRLDIRFF